MTRLNMTTVAPTAMEVFVVPDGVAAASKRKRTSHPADVMEKAVKEARHSGVTAAVLKINKELPPDKQVTVAAVDNWLRRWKREGSFWETERKRGRKNVLEKVDGAHAEWQKQLESLRKQGQAVTSRLSATVAKAVLEEKSPRILAAHGGTFSSSISSGRRLLSQDDKSYRKKSSSRILPPEDELLDKRDAFFARVRDCFPGEEIDAHLIINYDQTMHAYNPTRGFTWEKKGSGRVQIAETKEGFTLLPVVSAGGMIGAQLIFPGSTAASLPTVQPGPLLQYAQTSNHWSNEETTLLLFRSIIIPHIAARRAQLGAPAAPAIVFADAFAAHWTPAVKDLVAQEAAVAYVAVPSSLTHLFQPLDLGVIAAIKQSILRRKDEHMEGEVRVAIQQGIGVSISNSRPLMRNNVTQWIKDCVTDPALCGEHCCRVGFERAGILQLLCSGNFRAPDIDSVVPPSVCLECGELAVRRDDVPTCNCFATVASALLCDGCFDNHNTRCD